MQLCKTRRCPNNRRLKERRLEFAQTEAEFVADLIALTPQLQSWAASFVERRTPGDVLYAGKALATQITDVVDIEEMIWAPKYGINFHHDGFRFFYLGRVARED